MEFFTKSGAVKLRSHLGKYLVADDDREQVRQSRNVLPGRAQWMVEPVEGKNRRVRLKSCHGRYLTATTTQFLLGMTGNRVVQSDLEAGSDWKYEWEVMRDGFQVKMRSWCGTYLRGNGGTPPWRNSITHDEPYSAATKNWILWDVEAVESLDDLDSFSSPLSDDFCVWEQPPPMSGFSIKLPMSVLSMKLPMSVFSKKSPMKNSELQIISSSKFDGSGMEFFGFAGVVRLRSHHDKYLLADDNQETVDQDRDRSSKRALWVVEPVPDYSHVIRLKSCYGKYLTASNVPKLLGMTGRKVLQTLPSRLDSSVEWEPVRDGSLVKFKTRYGNYLRANGGLPPWRNSVTHDIPHRTATRDWVLWEVEVVETRSGEVPTNPPVAHSESLDSESSSADFSRRESSDWDGDSLPKTEGRTIYYQVAEDDKGDVQEYSMIFRGTELEDLTRKFEEETGVKGIIVCNRSPLNGSIYPLRLQLPPNNVTMRVVLVLPSSKLAQELEEQGLL